MGKLTPPIVLIYQKRKRGAHPQEQVKIVRYAHLPLQLNRDVNTLRFYIGTCTVGSIGKFHTALHIQ